MFTLFILVWLACNIVGLFFLLKALFEKDRQLWRLVGISFGGAVVCFFLMLIASPDDKTETAVAEAPEIVEEAPEVETAAVEEPVVEEPPVREMAESSSEPEEVSVEDPVEEIPDNDVANEEDPYSSLTKEQKMTLYNDMVTTTLNSTFENCYTISSDDTGVIINVWGEGLTYAALMVLSDESLRDTWTDMVGNCQYMAQSVYDASVTLGLDTPVMVNVLNDVNRENVLLSFVNGVLVYDATEAYDNG